MGEMGWAGLFSRAFLVFDLLQVCLFFGCWPDEQVHMPDMLFPVDIVFLPSIYLQTLSLSYFSALILF